MGMGDALALGFTFLFVCWLLKRLWPMRFSGPIAALIRKEAEAMMRERDKGPTRHTVDVERTWPQHYDIEKAIPAVDPLTGEERKVHKNPKQTILNQPDQSEGLHSEYSPTHIPEEHRVSDLDYPERRSSPAFDGSVVSEDRKS